MGSSLAGRLLVATPHIFDPNFSRAVVLIIEHGPDGALGVVLNRATEEPVAAHVPQWADLVAAPAVVFVGGPVSNEIAVGLAQAPVPAPEGYDPVFADIGLFDLSLAPGDFAAIAHLRVFSGYSGWERAQLEGELEAGGWFLADARPSDVFTTDPERLWREVIARQPGRLAFYATFPPDPRMN